MLVNGVTVGGRSHQAVALPLRCVCALDEEPRPVLCVGVFVNCPLWRTVNNIGLPKCASLGMEALVLLLVAH